MEIAALVAAVLALLVALSARSKASGLADGVDDARADARRRCENLAEEVEAELRKTRQLLALVASGEEVSRQRILDGQLWSDVTPEEGKRLFEERSPRLLDVRSPQETAGGVLPGAVLIPIDALESRAAELPDDGAPTLVYCAGGGRSAAACEFLASKGYANLWNLQGGISSWTGPIERPSGRPS